MEWYHITPINDMIEHNEGIVDENYMCLCNPKRDYDNYLIIHNSLDRRECFEGKTVDDFKCNTDPGKKKK